MAIIDGKYVTDAQVTDHLTPIGRTNLTGTGAVSDKLIQQHLAGAEGEIDSFLASRFTLPLTNQYESITGCALWFLQERLETLNRQLNEDTGRQGDACREFLEAVVKDERSLGPGEEDEAFEVAKPQSALDFDARIFTDGREVAEDNTTKERVGFASDPEPFSRP